MTLNAPFKDLRRHSRYLFVGLLIKGIFFWYFVRDTAALPHTGTWALWDADTWEYVDPVESYLSGNGFQPDHRMPGYALVYLLFRSFLSPTASADVITLLQLLLATVTCYALARGLTVVTGRRSLFWPAYGLLLVSAFHSMVELVLVNESFTTSALALHWVAYILFRRTGRRRWLVASGALVAWAIFMRPVYGPLIGLVPFIEFIQRGATWRRRITVTALFVAPFALADALWVIRNNRAYGGFHPLTNHGPYNPSFSAMPYYGVIWFVQAYGGHCYFWDPKADILWYGFEEDAGAGRERPVPGISEPPPYVYTSTYNRDSLIAFAEMMRHTRRPTTGQAERDSLAGVIMRTARRYREAFAREHPFQYQVMARLRLLKHETVHSGSATIFRHPFSGLNVMQKGYKLFQSLLYWFVLVGGMVGGAWLLLRFRSLPEGAILGAMVIYGVLACPFIMRMAEIRYLIPVYPLAAMAAVWLLSEAVTRRRAGRSAGPPAA